jgi:hypothetical protein
LGGVAELTAVTALGDEGGREHLLAFAGAGEEADGIFQEHGLVWGDRDHYGCGCFGSVGRVWLQEAGCIDGGSGGVADRIPHGVEEVTGGGGEDVDR